MNVNSLKFHVVVSFALVFLAFPSLLHPADFKIKAVVLNGDPAPEGGIFTNIIRPSMNNSGAIAFIGSSSTGGGIYVASDGGIQRIIKPGDVVNVPEFILTPPPIETFVDQDFAFYRFADGHTFACRKTMQVSIDPLFGIPFMNDSGDLLFGGVLNPNPPFSTTSRAILFSGGVLTDPLGCPGLTHLILDLTGESFFNIFVGENTSSINNAGDFVLTVETFRPFPTPVGRGFPFLFSGGTPTLLTSLGDGSVIDINDSGALLIQSPQGIFLDSTPVALLGGPAGQGKTFTGFLPAVNNKGEVVFIGILNDFSSAIFHWANGTLTPLVRLGDPTPAGGRFTRFFSVQLNDNGDVVFHVEIGSLTGVFRVSTKGGSVSKIVFPGDAAPGGEIFTVVGEYQLNNKGQVAFVGGLSNGHFGLFLGSSASLETEFVDPLPDLLADAAVTSDPTDLANKGRPVTGIAADGTAQVVVRVKTGQAGNVEFSLVDGSGTPLRASNFNGFLSQVGEATGSGAVSVSAVDVAGSPMAFAAYHAPMDFASGPNTFEAGQSEREISIRIRLTTSTGETVESTESLRIVRPPVILVHGLWGSRGSWSDFAPLSQNGVSDGRFSVDLVDYFGTNAADFHINGVRLLAALPQLVERYKARVQAAAVRADVVTHSMGGLIARMLPLFDSAFFRNDNYQQGDVHKLINIATPHFGSELARLLRNDGCVNFYFSLSGNRTDQGAVEELVPGSQALNEINQLSSPLALHNVLGVASQQQIGDSESAFWFRVLTFLCQGSNIRRGLNFIHRNRPHDLVVDTPSQQGALLSVSQVQGVIHTPVNRVFVGVGELESPLVSEEIITLLNQPLIRPVFTQFSPTLGP